MFDSFILSDFNLIGKSFKHTLEINSLVNGIGMFGAMCLYGMICGEQGFVDKLKDLKGDMYFKDKTIISLNVITAIGYLL